MKSLCFDGFIDVEYMATSNLVADIFTKATDKASFVKLRNIMMNRIGILRGYLALAVPALHGASLKLASTLLERV